MVWVQNEEARIFIGSFIQAENQKLRVELAALKREVDQFSSQVKCNFAGYPVLSFFLNL